MADDPIEGLAVGLAADHQADKRKRKAKPAAEGSDSGRRDFSLDEQKSESFRAAQEDTADSAMEMFWRRMGGDLGFRPESVILKTTPESGSITFTAIPSEEAEQREELQGAIAGLGDAIEARDEAEGELMPAISRLSTIAEESLPEGRALVRFATTFMLDQIKHSPRWSDLLEAGQRDLAATIQTNAEDLVTKIIEAVRANGAQPIRALLESYSEKDGIKASLKIKPIDDEEALQAIIGLHRAQGKHVLVTVASAQDFDQSPAEIPIEPDEPGLGFDAGDDSDLAGGDDE